MLHIPLDPQLERHLAEIAARVGEAPGELARKALLAYLEDLEDLRRRRRGVEGARLRQDDHERGDAP